ncbi:MAG: PorP/SprF family type IX secretion system membrane protein [Haliscomenobacter sp.]|nr:PorP/SprF family type IX secretion system membrane protein [Haliscomenobacter sp.]
MNKGIPSIRKFPICWFFWGGFMLFATFLSAQDIHWTQFYAAPMNISPGLVGIFPGETRFMGNYRSQWHSVPVDYRTLGLSVDSKLPNKRADRHFVTLGLGFNYDQGGVSRLNFTNLNLNGSYTQRLASKFYATLGGQWAFAQRRFQTKGLIFDDQYDPSLGGIDPALPTQEDFSNRRNFFTDLNVGLNFRFQARDDNELVDRLAKRTKIDAGFGIYHLNTPLQNFIEDDFSEIDLPIRFTPYILATVKVGSNLDLIYNAMFQTQTSYRQWLNGIGAKLHLNRTPGKQLSIQFVANYRSYDFEESIAPAFEIFYNHWRAGFSYDVNVSEFEVATRGKSGPEIFVHYHMAKAKRKRLLPEYKICPLI